MMTVCLTGVAQHRVCNAPRTVFMGWQEQQQVNRDIYEMLLKDSLIDDGDTLNIYPVFVRYINTVFSQFPESSSATGSDLSRLMYPRPTYFTWDIFNRTTTNCFYMTNANGRFLAYLEGKGDDVRLQTGYYHNEKFLKQVFQHEKVLHPSFFFTATDLSIVDRSHNLFMVDTKRKIHVFWESKDTIQYATFEEFAENENMPENIRQVILNSANLPFDWKWKHRRLLKNAI